MATRTFHWRPHHAFTSFPAHRIRRDPFCHFQKPALQVINTARTSRNNAGCCARYCWTWTIGPGRARNRRLRDIQHWPKVSWRPERRCTFQRYPHFRSRITCRVFGRWTTALSTTGHGLLRRNHRVWARNSSFSFRRSM